MSKKKRGQPSRYRAEYANLAEKLCKLGLTDEQLATVFEVDERTINNWKQAHPEFFQSLKRGKLIADANVADRLYQRAMGYSTPLPLLREKPTRFAEYESTQFWPVKDLGG